MSVRHVRFLRFLFTYLTQRLTPAGRSMFLIWFIAALQGSVSLDIPIYHIWSFTTVCLALAWLFSWIAVPKLQLIRHLPQPVMAGTMLTYTVELKNDSHRAAYALSVSEMDIPAGLKPAPGGSPTAVARLAPHANMTLSLQLHGSKRGHYKLSGLCAASSYPLGLCRGMSFHAQETYVTVYPAYAVPDAFNLPLRASVPSANLAVANSYALAATSPDFAYIREYRDGDDPRHMHWASWARLGMPAIKVYQEEAGSRVGLVLDTAVQNQHDMHALESGISAIAGIAAYLLGEGIFLDCFATEHHVCRFPDGATNMRFTALLHTLAEMQASETVHWPSLAARLFSQTPQCNTIVLITLDWSQEIAGFVSQLQHHGLVVRTLVIRQGPASWPLPVSSAATHLLPGNPWPQAKPSSPWRGP